MILSIRYQTYNDDIYVTDVNALQNFTNEHIFNTSDYIQDAVTALTLSFSTCLNDSSLSNQTCIKDSLKNLQFSGTTVRNILCMYVLCLDTL